MVLDVEPVAHLLAVAVDRQRLAGEGVDDHQRDQLLGKMKRAVVVGAVGRQHRQAVGVMPGADQVVARRLARRIGAVRLVGVGLAERRIVPAEAAVDLVGRDVKEAERLLLVRGQLRPVRARRLEQREGALDVGADELGRAVDAAVDVALGGEVHDRARPMGREQAVDQRPVADVAAHEHVALRRRRATPGSRGCRRR